MHHWRFEDDASSLYLRSRFIGLNYNRLVEILDGAIAHRKEPFRLRARSVQGSGCFIELTLLAANSEPGDERLASTLNAALEASYGPDHVVMILTIHYKDLQ